MKREYFICTHVYQAHSYTLKRLGCTLKSLVKVYIDNHEWRTFQTQRQAKQMAKQHIDTLN